jgi:hypothetical protein
MRSIRYLLSTAALSIAFASPGGAALGPTGPEILVDEAPYCAHEPGLGVAATPKGAFAVVWVDDSDDFAYQSRRYDRGLVGGPIHTLRAYEGGQFGIEVEPVFAGDYQIAVNILDFDADPGDPWAAYRVQLALNGEPLGPATRLETGRFLALFPGPAGESLQVRWEPPIWGPTTCQSWGLRARRVAQSGAALFPEHRVTGRASGATPGRPSMTRTGDGRFAIAWPTCDRFVGVVARRLDAQGAPRGRIFDFALPARSGALEVAAHRERMAVAGVIAYNVAELPQRAFAAVVVGNSPHGPHLLPPLPEGIGLQRVVDLAVSATGRHVVLLQGSGTEQTLLFAQELDDRGRPLGAPLQLGPSSERGMDGAVASLGGDRWVVVTRQQLPAGDLGDACSERIVARVLRDGGS